MEPFIRLEHGVFCRIFDDLESTHGPLSTVVKAELITGYLGKRLRQLWDGIETQGRPLSRIRRDFHRACIQDRILRPDSRNDAGMTFESRRVHVHDSSPGR